MGPSFGCLSTVSGLSSAGGRFFAPVTFEGLSEGFLDKSLENFRRIRECMLFILWSECRLYTEGRVKCVRPAFAGDAWPAPLFFALSKICWSSWRSSDLVLVTWEFGDVEPFDRRGRFAGVASVTRTLGSSGESARPSCSAVQHSLEAMLPKGGVWFVLRL